MSYDVVLTAKAEAELARIPEEFRLIIEEHLFKLGDAPASLSRTPVFPYPPLGQLYEFDVDYGGNFHDHFAIFFR